MKTILIVMALLVSIPVFGQVKVNASKEYGGAVKTFSGKPTTTSWSKDSVLFSRGERLVIIDNSKGLDTLWFGFQAADTASTKRYRLYPGETYSGMFNFLNNIVMFWRVPSDSTLPIQWWIL